MAESRNSLVPVLLVVLAVLVLGPLVLMTLAMPMMGMWWGVGMGSPTTSLVGLVAFAVPLLVVVALALVGYWAFRRWDGGSDPAVEELRRAYARGDLTDEEFDRRLARLRREE